jgi:hypothetical protein
MVLPIAIAPDVVYATAVVVAVDTLATLGVMVGVTPAAWDLIPPATKVKLMAPITVLTKTNREVFNQPVKVLTADLLCVWYIDIFVFKKVFAKIMRKRTVLYDSIH